MNYLKFYFLLISLLFIKTSYAQKDSTVTKFSGSIGITNNGFSIIPTFSLHRPATIMNFSWRRNQFSFEPDIRLVSDASKGGMIFWLRYRLIQHQKFSLRLGVHPAFTFIRRTITDNGVQSEITEMLRFAAGEIVPNYQITPNWSIGAMYLQGNALQKHGPQLTQVVFLNTSISNIKLWEDFRFQIIPTVYFLTTDGFRGDYFSATGILSNKNFPFTVQSTINQTLESDVPNNKDFMWNVMLSYNFNKNLKSVK